VPGHRHECKRHKEEEVSVFNNIRVHDARNRPPHLVGEALLKHFDIAPGSQAAHALSHLDFVAAAEQARFAVESSLAVDEHRARQVSVEMLTAADLILVMSDGHRRAISQMAPQVSGKTMLFGRWLAGGQGEEIPDPYRKSEEAFRHAHQKLVEAAALWVKKLM